MTNYGLKIVDANTGTEDLIAMAPFTSEDQAALRAESEAKKDTSKMVFCYFFRTIDSCEGFINRAGAGNVGRAW